MSKTNSYAYFYRVNVRFCNWSFHSSLEVVGKCSLFLYRKCFSSTFYFPLCSFLPVQYHILGDIFNLKRYSYIWSSQPAEWILCISVDQETARGLFHCNASTRYSTRLTSRWRSRTSFRPARRLCRLSRWRSAWQVRCRFDFRDPVHRNINEMQSKCSICKIVTFNS